MSTSRGRKSLTKISDHIINEQVEDIKAYTSGHLNENHLWRPPRRREGRREWTSFADLIHRREERLRPHLQLFSTRTVKDEDENGGDGEKQDHVGENHMQTPIVRDKDMSLTILSSHLAKATTKAEKLANLVEFQKESSRGPTNLNQALNLMQFQTERALFEDLIQESKIFGEVLRRIKDEYESYIEYLVNYENDNNEDESLKNIDIESVKSKILKQRRQIELVLVEDELAKINSSIKRLIKENLDVENQIMVEEMFANEKRQKQGLDQIRDAQAAATTTTIRKMNLKEKIEQKTNSILKNLDDINKLREKLRKDYVPSVVVNNLSQTNKDLEIENHKIMEQNKFLQSEEIDAENELRNVLLKNDKTEFAEENVEYLLKVIKNFELLKLNKSDEKPVPEFQHFYDDYFS